MLRTSALLLLPLIALGTARISAAADLPLTHLRMTQPEARALVEKAIQESPTIREELAKLEATDVVAYLTLTPFLSLPTARTTFISAAGSQRFVSLALNERNEPDDLLVYLGHELQHVLEVADAPEVCDASSFERLYKRIGRPSGEEIFETDAALAAGQEVRMEIHEVPATARPN